MAHIPYGYQIIDGCAVIDETKAAEVRKLYACYLKGDSIIQAGKHAGLSFPQRSLNNMLQNEIYIRDDYYPSILDERMFYAAEEERKRRWQKLRHPVNQPKPAESVKTSFLFRLENLSKIQTNDPLERISLLYACIEWTEEGTVLMKPNDQNQVRAWTRRNIRYVSSNHTCAD